MVFCSVDLIFPHQEAESISLLLESGQALWLLRQIEHGRRDPVLVLGTALNFYFLSLNTHSWVNQAPCKKSNYPENAICEEAGHVENYLEIEMAGQSPLF